MTHPDERDTKVSSTASPGNVAMKNENPAISAPGNSNAGHQIPQ